MKLASLACFFFCLSARAASLDDFSSTDAWKAIHSEDVQASLEFPQQGAQRLLRLNYNFGKVSGYAVATRALPITFPENYEFSFRVRGTGSANELQLKFVDASGDNVWWYPKRNFQPTAEWQTIRVKKRHVDFAWGTTADKVLRNTARIELTLNAATGGSGYLEFDSLALTPVPAIGAMPKPRAVAFSIKDSPANHALDGNPKTFWMSDRDSPQSFTVDFGGVREFGGLEVDWHLSSNASQYDVQVSDDGKTWRTICVVDVGNGGRDSMFLPESEGRALRLQLHSGPSGRFAIEELRLLDVSIGTSANAFFRHLSKSAQKGTYPRGIAGEQSYWTVVGTAGGQSEALMGEDGAIELRQGGYSIEPFLKTDNSLITWADVTAEQSLLDDYLPIPRVVWRHPQVDLEIVAIASGSDKSSSVIATYKVTNKTSVQKDIVLTLSVRPFQVNPPSQFLGTPGGVAAIRDVAWDGRKITVNGLPGPMSLSPVNKFDAGQFDRGPVTEWFSAHPPTRSAQQPIHDATGFASAALQYHLRLTPGQSQTTTIAMPLDGDVNSALDVNDALSKTKAQWASTLDRVRFDVPADGKALIDTLRTSHAHILINRDGAALQPGSRSYSRAWIRDGAMEADTLLRLGDSEPAKEFLRWYAPRLFANGKVPCCVDHRGSDPVPENDSAGEFVFLVADIYRYTHDRVLLEEMWSPVSRAMTYLESLRIQERTPEILQSKQRAFYGMVPASISHEGYSAKPMHSYWDNFWTMKGYNSAVDIATALNKPEAKQYRESRDEFRRDLKKSLEQAMLDSNIRYLPGSAELGDFDATSTSIGVSPAGDTRLMPESSLVVTFERYWSQFIAREKSTTWEDYTPYELRNVATFAHLGSRDRASALLKFFMNDRRPTGWNQWAEVVGREYRKERFIGDMPHSWVGSDYIRSVLDLFAYERSEDQSLVVMAGIPSSWFDQGFGVDRLRTPYGELQYSVKPSADGKRIEIQGIDLPPGGLIVDLTDIPFSAMRVMEGKAQRQGERIVVSKLPVTFEIR